MYVYLDAGVDGGVDEGVDPNSNALISQLRDEVAYLRDENRRKDEIIMQQAMTMRQLSAASPQEPSEAPQTVEEPERAPPPRAGTGEAEAAAEERSEAEPRLLWERVAVVILAALPVFLLLVLGLAPDFVLFGTASVVAGAALGWVVFPAVFGFRLGRKVRSLRFWSNVAPVAALLWLVVFIAGRALAVVLTGTESVFFAVFFAGVPSLAYSFAAVLGNALRRRSREKLIEERPSEFPQEAAASAQGWTPRQQAFVGLAGTIISALIGLIGTILTVLDRT